MFTDLSRHCACRRRNGVDHGYDFAAASISGSRTVGVSTESWPLTGRSAWIRGSATG